MSIDTWTAVPVGPATKAPALSEPRPARASRTSEVPPALVAPQAITAPQPLVVTPSLVTPPRVSSARALAEAHRARLARRLVSADALVAILAAGAGLTVGYAQGESVPELAALVIGVNLFWFLRLWRSRPLAVPLVRL
ncbi:hypothetical protein, partial [Tsukamurella pulmonis]